MGVDGFSCLANAAANEKANQESDHSDDQEPDQDSLPKRFLDTKLCISIYVVHESALLASSLV